MTRREIEKGLNDQIRYREGSSSTRREIVDCLEDKRNGENSRKLLAFCREPRTFGEMGKAGVRGDLFKVLGDLKKVGAILWVDKKFCATQEALDVLESL